MSASLTNETRSENRTVNKNVEITAASYASYIDDITDQEEPELTEEDSLDSPEEANEESDDDNDNNDDDYYSSSEALSVQPIWILYEGQILWSASHYGFNLASKEYFRRRIQTLLDFLRKKFPGKTYGELLLSLQGFFARDNESSKGNWLDLLKNSGILYFDEGTNKYKIIPLGNFRASKGQGKILPGKIEALWLEHEFSEIEKDAGEQTDIEQYKASLIGNFKAFCSELSDKCSTFTSQEEDDSEEEGETVKKRGIGIKKIEFVYEESTLDRKKFNDWKKLWSKR